MWIARGGPIYSVNNARQLLPNRPHVQFGLGAARPATERGQLWLRKQRRRRRPKRHAPRSNQTGPAPKAGPDHFQRVFRR